MIVNGLLKKKQFSAVLIRNGNYYGLVKYLFTSPPTSPIEIRYFIFVKPFFQNNKIDQDKKIDQDIFVVWE